MCPFHPIACVCNMKDGIASPEDIDKVMTDGLGLRYSLIGPFETIHLNANGEYVVSSHPGHMTVM